MQTQHMLVSIEGNIGSGKSTLVEVLRNASFNRPHIVIQEDVKSWTSFTDSTNQNILEYFYQNKTKYGFAFQTLVVTSRIKHILDAIRKNPDAIIITERSHFTDLKIFVDALFAHGELSEIEYLTYKSCHELLDQLLNTKVDAIIYNRTTPDICMGRICKRSRKGEDLIPSQYIRELHQRHEDWLLDENHTTPTFTIDGNIDEMDTSNRIQQIASVVNYINNL